MFVFTQGSGWWRWLWVALGVFGLVIGGVAVAASPDTIEPLMLNEILADPQRDWNGDGLLNSRDDEWVEIVNVGISAVTLDDYRLAGADTSWRYGFSGGLAPGGVLVVYGNQSYAWETANGAPRFGLRLTNTGGTIGLWRVASEDTVLVDSYTFLDHEADPDRSTGRLPDGGGLWRVFDALNPYIGTTLPLGTGCAPSPGALFLCPTPARPTTWGDLKARY
jgi:Lamin Tail Domain